MKTERSLEIATPTDRDIVMTRVLEASAARVFEAFTTPAILARWLLGPDGWSLPTCEVDLRVGGRFRYVWRDDTNARQFGITGVYREIAPPERIVHLETFDDAWIPGQAVITTTFAERDGSTTVTLACLYSSREVRDIALGSGTELGAAASYDRLDALLQSNP